MENPLGGRYRLHERIGAGGMGEVWRATDEVLGRPVAVKVVLAARVGDPRFLQRFLVEARAMASVRHPGVVAIHDFNGADGAAYLVMEYVEGESLAQLLARRGRLDPGYTMELVRQVALALQAVHDRGIVHRDVKPANVLIRPDGTAALTDFGIALPGADNAVTTTGMILGTPSYLAPEQVLGQPATPLSDVYSLGLVGYECVAGRRPFVGDNPIAVALQRAHQPAPPLGPEVPASVAAVIDRALAIDPAHRWAGAAEFADAAARAGAGSGLGDRSGPTAWVGTASPVGSAATVPTSVHKGRRRLVPGLAVLAVLAALAVAGLVLRSPESPGSAGPERPGSPTGASGKGPTDPGPAATGPAGTGTAGTGTAGTGTAGTGTAGTGLAGVPAGPLCWAGLNIFGGVLQPLHRVGCDEPHYWETFAVAPLPADATAIRDDTLMELPDVAAICSTAAMTRAAREAAMVAQWERDGVPFTTTAGSTVLLCIAGRGETTGSVFLST